MSIVRRYSICISGALDTLLVGMATCMQIILMMVNRVSVGLFVLYNKVPRLTAELGGCMRALLNVSNFFKIVATQKVAVKK